jgi:hypothetical protein
MKEVKNYNKVKVCSSKDFCPSSSLVTYIRYSHYTHDESCIEKQKEAIAQFMCKHSEVKL